MRVRTRARELALQFLYQIDVQGPEQREAFDEFLDAELAGKPGASDAKKFARELLDGVLAHRDEIDDLLRKAATNWELQRMARVDRNALRIGCYELLHAEDIPMKVAINEAIELSKRFSTESSGAFVNGILDRIRKEQGL